MADTTTTSAFADYVIRLTATELDDLIRAALVRKFSDEKCYRSVVVVDGNSSAMFTVYPAPPAARPTALVALDEATLRDLGYESEAEFWTRLSDQPAGS